MLLSNKTWIVLLIGLLAGCSGQVAHLQSRFDESKTREMLREGTASIHGSALWRQKGGGVVTCAGLRVEMVPATEYAAERMRAIFGNSVSGYHTVGLFDSFPRFENTPAAYDSLVRASTCDAQGNFVFDRVGSYDFFLLTRVTWEVPVSRFSSSTEGGFLMRRVSVHEAEDVRVVLSP